MKHFLLAAFLVSAGFLSYGQCDKKVAFTSSKTEHLAADSSITRSEDETTVIEFDKTTISITPGENTLTGKVKSYTCDWSTPYKVGRTRLTATITSPNGESREVTITIEGKGDKIVLIAEIDDPTDKKIRLYADKFAEKL